MRIVARFLRDESAATSVEYSVILALILMVVLSAIVLVGNQTGSLWGNIATSIESPGP